MSGFALVDSPSDPRESLIIGTLDPRTRLIAAFGFVAVLVALHGLPTLALALVVALGLVGLARVPFHTLLHRLMHVEGFMVLVLLFLPFTVPGHPRLVIGPLVATDEGLLRAMTLLLRINAAVLAVLALLGSLEPVRLGHAMSRLGMPSSLVHLFLLAVRYIGVIRAETERLLDSLRARAFVPRSDWHTWRTFGNLGGMILVRSFERAERVREAMLCRAFSGHFPLTADGVLSRADAAFGAGLAAVAVCLVVADGRI